MADEQKISKDSSFTQLTRSGARRLGDEYQDVQAIDRLVDWLEHHDRYQWMKLEADESGFLDDILALRVDGTLEAWQVKFSTASHKPEDIWTWERLMEQKPTKTGHSPSLLQKWFDTWQKLGSQGVDISPGLLSNRRAAPELGLNGSPNDKVSWNELSDDARQTITAHLGNDTKVQAFFECFCFRLNEPSLRELELGAWARFTRLSGNLEGWHALQKAVREWVNTKHNPAPDGEISLDDLFRLTGLKEHPVRLETFLPPARFFEHYLDTTRLFHHHWPQVGHQEPLNALFHFVDGNEQIALLPGRGGNGKSKLIHTLCRRLTRRRPDLFIRLAAENLPIKNSALEELPSNACLIVVDDAHRIQGIEVLLAAARQNPTLKVLLVTRPHATDYLNAQIRQAGFDAKEVVVHAPLPELKHPHEHLRLARLALGSDLAHYANQLARITRDCPLMTMLGGQLLRSKKVSPALLTQDSEFRREVLARFRDILLGEVAPFLEARITPQMCAESLPLIAVTTPLDTANTELIGALAGIAGIDRAKFQQLIGVLIKAGAMVRGGNLVRIVPDVLSDFILSEACFTADGAVTGWASTVYQALAHLPLDTVLRNLAELDWRITSAALHENASLDTSSSIGSGLLDEIWNDLHQRFRDSSLVERKAWLKRFERIAFMQTHRLWSFVEIVLNDPLPEDPNEIIRPALKPWIHPTTQEDVLAALSPVLRGIACDERFTAQCADLLWELGRNIVTESKSSPHAIETLRHLASYERYKPLVFSQIVLECCREWMRDPNIYSYPQSILAILSPMLNRKINWTEMEGNWLSYGSFIVAPFREFRREVMELVEACALSGIRSTVLQAIQALHISLSEDGLWEIREQHPEEWQAWEEDQIMALGIVARIAESNEDPFVHLKIWEALHWQAERGPRPTVQRRAQEILDGLPLSFEAQFIILLSLVHFDKQYQRTWEFPEESDDAWLKDDAVVKRHERHQEFVQGVTQEWIKRYPDPQEGFDALSKWIEVVETSGWWKQAWTRHNSFITRLAQQFPSYAHAWCEIALTKQDARATEKCEDLLCVLRHHDPSATWELVQQFMASGHPNLHMRVASSYAWPGWPDNPLPEEWHVIGELLSSPEYVVRLRTADIVVSIAATEPHRALQFVREVEIGTNTELAERLFSIFVENSSMPVREIEHDDFTLLLEKLSFVESVHPYHLGKFLLHAALRDPLAVAQLLLKRLRHKVILNQNRWEIDESDQSQAKELEDAYNGLPEFSFHDEKFQAVVSHPEYADALRLIRDAALGEEYQSVMLWQDTLSELFHDFSLNYGATSLEILDEWINSGDCTKVRCTMRLLEDTYLGFYLKNVPFISNYLSRARQCGRTLQGEVERKMVSRAVYGPPRAMAFHVGERSNALFYKAQKVLDTLEGDALTAHFFQQLRTKGQEMLQDEKQRQEVEEIYYRS